MIIIAGYTRVEATKRDAAAKSFAGLVERARQQEGCLDFALSADPVDTDRINVFECWRDQKALNAWRKVAKAPSIKLKKAVVKLYRSDKAEKPF